MDDDSIVVAAAGDETYALLIAAGHEIGNVTYVDRDDAGVLEVLVRTTDDVIVSVVLSLQGRSNGTTEAFVSVEPLSVATDPALVPSPRGLARLFANHLNAR